MKATCFHKGIHLSESDLYKNNDQFPICQSLNRTTLTYIQRDPDIFLKYCNNCYAVSASRIPTVDTLNSYYTSYYQSNDEKITFDAPDIFATHLFNETCNFLKKTTTLSILDYGGGCGTISIDLAKKYLDSGIKEVNVIIVDLDQSQIISDSQNLTIKKYSALFEIKNQKFDIVIASAIIEHLPNPKDEILSLFELVDEKGLIYFRTPYVIPLLLLLQKVGINLDFTYPGHIHDLGQKFWDTLLNTVDFKNEFNILYSSPSIVETSFSKHFWRTLIAYLIKSPWSVFGNRWNLVGGWEILYQRKSKCYQNNPTGSHL